MADAAPKERLLVLMCSETKKTTPDQAINLYDGPVYQSLRKALQELDPKGHPRIIILSAKYGWLHCNEKIAPYNERMSSERANMMIAGGIDTRLHDLTGENKPGVMPSDMTFIQVASNDSEKTFLGVGPYKDVLMVGGAAYQRVMNAAITQFKERGAIDPDASINDTVGQGIGAKRATLCAWLSRKPGRKDLEAGPHSPNRTS